MYLKSLKIEKSTETIREINFRKGINIIVDETDTGNSKASGNNVGKTTVLRLVHYCLGSDGKNIYTDTEFKKNGEDTLIKKFLTDNGVVVTLTLSTSLNEKTEKTVEIRRNFLLRKDKILEINGAKVSELDFDKELKKAIFNVEIEKPTFKQIVAKNIRDEKNRLTHTVKFLSPYTTKEEYEVLYLFLLGVHVESIEEKNRLMYLKRQEEKIQSRLSESGNLSQIEQFLEIVNRKINELEKEKERLSKLGEQDNGLDKMASLQQEMGAMNNEIARLETRRSLILESKAEIEKDVKDLDTEEIKQLYSSAQRYIPDLQKDFEEVLAFHYSMMQEKISFLTQELPSINSKVEELKVSSQTLQGEYFNISSRLNSNQTFQEIIVELNSAHEKRGELNELKRLWDESRENLKKIDEDILIINREIENKQGVIKERVSIFNKYFSDLSYRLYSESFVLSTDDSSGSYELLISNMEGNTSTGKKKGQIAAFDLAYIQFATEIVIPHLKFVMHDQIENIHDILKDVVQQIDCQYVVPVLKDKLPNNTDWKQHVILSLSQKEKLFKV
jgi:uncharacterized protein YydD (DUF2326 family)